MICVYKSYECCISDIVAIFYPFSQFCEIDVSLPSLQNQPKHSPKSISEGGRKWQVWQRNVMILLMMIIVPWDDSKDLGLEDLGMWFRRTSSHRRTAVLGPGGPITLTFFLVQISFS